MANKTPSRNHDGTWKRVIRLMFPDFLAYFLPNLFTIVDFNRSPEFLDKELNSFNQSIMGKTKGKRIADCLIKVFCKDGIPRIVILHIEIQIGRDPLFAFRMFQMYGRILENHLLAYGKLPWVEALAIFPANAYKNPPDRFEQKHYHLHQCYKYDTFCVRPEKEAELLKHPNPFALVELAYIRANTSKHASKIRERFLLELLLLSRQKKYSQEYQSCLFFFILNIVSVPEENRFVVFNKLKQTKKEDMFKIGAPEIDYINFLVETYEGKSLEDIKKEMKDFQEERNVLKEKYEEETQLRLEEQKRREQEEKLRLEEQKRREQEEKLRLKEQKRREQEEKLRLEAQKRQEQEEQKRKETESKLRKSVIGFYELALSPQKIADLTGGELDWVHQIIETYQKNKD